MVWFFNIQLIWHRTEFRLVLIQSGKYTYYPNLIYISKIQNRLVFKLNCSFINTIYLTIHMIIYIYHFFNSSSLYRLPHYPTRMELAPCVRLFIIRWMGIKIQVYWSNGHCSRVRRNMFYSATIITSERSERSSY